MDSLTILGVTVAALATAPATFGLLPERVDLMFVLAAYGAGTIVGGLIGGRPRLRRQPMGLERRGDPCQLREWSPRSGR